MILKCLKQIKPLWKNLRVEKEEHENKISKNLKNLASTNFEQSFSSINAFQQLKCNKKYFKIYNV